MCIVGKEDERKLNELLDGVRGYIDDPAAGLPEEIFRFITEVTPLVNVDLLIRDDRGILLAWRNDDVWGTGWHVPGGILRLKESFEERVRKTALSEIGCEVAFHKNPIEIRPVIGYEFKQRGHHISFIYDCTLPKGYCINNHGLKEHDTGYLAWHKFFPQDMLKCHLFYEKYFHQ